MTFVNFLIIATVFIILLALNSFVRKYIRQNRSDIKTLQQSLNDIKNLLGHAEVPKTTVPEPETEKEAAALLASKVKPEEKTYLEPAPEPSQEGPKTEQVQEELKKEIKVEADTKAAAPKEEIPVQKTVKARKSFMERYPDLEKFIGENLINKIGIVILVLGIGFLVKYAIDKNWINEIGRVAIGILSAGALIGLAHKMRKNYKSFSSVLVGGGLALLYFTITLAYHTEGYPLYQQQTVSLIMLTIITLFAVFLSIGYNRVELAILAILGGFGSPLMVSDGSGNYIVLFSYLMILNIGMLVLSYYKKWRLVNIVAFAFTVLLFASWLISELVGHRYAAFGGAIIFATGFYIIFFLMNIIYNLKHDIRFKIGDISLLLSNTFIYFTFVMIMLSHISYGEYKGLFAILLGAFNFIFAYYTHKRQRTDTNLLYLLIGLVFTFITLAIPLQLKGNYITLFWSVESVLLLWLGQKSGFKIMKLGSCVVAFLLMISILMDWSNHYDIIGYSATGYVKQLGFLLNRMFITTVVTGASLVAILILLKKEKENIAWIFPVKAYKSIILGLTILVFYVGGLLEVNYQTYHYYIANSSQAIAAYAFNAVFVLLLLVVALKLKERTFSIIIAALSTLFVLIFLSAISNAFANNITRYIRGDEILGTSLLLFRWVSIVAAYAISVLLFRLVNKVNGNLRNRIFELNISLLIFTIIYLLSADLDSIAVLITKNRDVLFHTQKIGYAILWGVSSFLLMMIGMRQKEKLVRILSLALFAITIIKLFVYDLSSISEGGKIVSFILLGILLLIISFMYQKVKKLVIDDNFTDELKDTENINTKD